MGVCLHALSLALVYKLTADVNQPYTKERNVKRRAFV